MRYAYGNPFSILFSQNPNAGMIRGTNPNKAWTSAKYSIVSKNGIIPVNSNTSKYIENKMINVAIKVKEFMESAKKFERIPVVNTRLRSMKSGLRRAQFAHPGPKFYMIGLSVGAYVVWSFHGYIPHTHD